MLAMAGVTSDLIRDTAEMAGGHAESVYFAEYMPAEVLPRGKKSVELWIRGFSTIFQVIHGMFEAGSIPTAGELEQALSQLPRDKQKIIEAYGKEGAEADSVLRALVYGAKEEWEANEFQDTHCQGGQWDALPACAEHDLDWTLAEVMLVG
jgi:hypothetical protein